MFRSPPEGPSVGVVVEGVALRVPAGTSAAGAALLAGLGHTRTHPADGSPRAPFCMMGVCFECLMVIDGVASRHACLVAVREGMAIARQQGARGLG